MATLDREQAQRARARSNPHDGATLRASSPAVTAAEKEIEPIQSSWRHGLPSAVAGVGRRPRVRTRVDTPAGPLLGGGGRGGARSWPGRTTTASTAATAISGSSPQNSARHP